MKASAVSQSFKALASKINNQAPLGPKESNRLLKSLTKSFRKHLDEVHPRQPPDDGKRPAAGVASQNTDRHAMHSSAVLADKHMASVLTNPLLVKNAKPAAPPGVKPEVDAENAAIELRNGANPFDLLESYEAKGRANIGVTVCIMRHFRLSINKLSYEEQVQKVQTERAGFRVLSWLWNSQIMYSQAFVDNHQIQDGLVWLLMMEDCEEVLWQWLDSGLELQQPTKSVVRGNHDVRGGAMWKSRILYAMVMTKLGGPNREARSADAALNIYFRAVQNVHGRDATVLDKMALASRARLELENTFSRGYLHHYYNTSPLLYDKFSTTISNHDAVHPTHDVGSRYTTTKAAQDVWLWRQALLDLWHPTRSRADAVYDLLSQKPFEGGLFAVYDRIRYTGQSQERTFYMNTIARAAFLLKTAGQHSQSAKLTEMARKMYPDHVKQFEKTLAFAFSAGLNGVGTQEQRPVRKSQEQQRQQEERLKDFGWLPPYSPAPT